MEFFVFTGYLKAVSRRFEEDTIYATLTIPNIEIRYIYRNTIRNWFGERKKDYDATPFYEGMRTGNCEKIEDFINGQLLGEYQLLRQRGELFPRISSRAGRRDQRISYCFQSGAGEWEAGSA